jgi:LysM repeat protein
MQIQEHSLIRQYRRIITVLAGLVCLMSLTIILLVSCKTHTNDDDAPFIYIIRSGDTIELISDISGLSIETINKYNHIDNPTKLQSGKILLLPGVKKVKNNMKFQQLDIIERNSWGAIKTQPMLEATPFTKITVHHTTDDENSSKRSEVHFLQLIQKYHINENKWADIGYHFIISPSGKIYEGRLLSNSGAHVKNNNQGNIGIALLGNYDKEDLTKEEKDSLQKLIEALRERYSIKKSELYGHGELGKTKCPGIFGLKFINTLR